MTRPEILERLRAVFIEVLRSKDLRLEESLAQGSLRGWDSMNHVQIIVKLQGQFNLELATEDVLGLKTVGDMIDLVERKLPK